MDHAFCITFLLVLNHFPIWLWQAQAVTDISKNSEQQREADLLFALPGQPYVPFAQYAGYVTVNVSHGRALFYWFIEATANASSKPLLLWLNGGPGCSSVGYGAAQEIGPFRVQVNGTGLHLNKYSWNTEANLLFVESPAGVFFSYSNVSSDYANFGDELTAKDTYAFLEGWFKRFPHYMSNYLFIAGESYAGHYVPELAEMIYDRNMQASTYPFFHLKGFMVGNPTTDDYHDTRGFVDYAWSHAVISDQTYKNVQELCDFKSNNWTALCGDVVNSIFGQYKAIDIYSLYTPVCLLDYGTSNNSRKAAAGFTWSRLAGFYRENPSSCGDDPCVEIYVQTYFNRPDVQKALHANVTGLPYSWSQCSAVLTDWADSPFSVLPIYKKLIAAGLRILVYSGDTDGRVPVTATRYSLNALGLAIKKPWRAWYHEQQVGGWTQENEGLIFVTVRGAGHMVPSSEPSRALAIFTSLLSGQTLSQVR